MQSLDRFPNWRRRVGALDHDEVCGLVHKLWLSAAWCAALISRVGDPGNDEWLGQAQAHVDMLNDTLMEIVYPTYQGGGL